MAEIDERTAELGFESDQLHELSELAAAFIQEELDAELMEELDDKYLETLVAHPDSVIPSDLPPEVHRAAVETANFILQQLNGANQ